MVKSKNIIPIAIHFCNMKQILKVGTFLRVCHLGKGKLKISQLMRVWHPVKAHLQINPEFRILRLTFHRKSATKY